MSQARAKNVARDDGAGATQPATKRSRKQQRGDGAKSEQRKALRKAKQEMKQKLVVVKTALEAIVANPFLIGPDGEWYELRNSLQTIVDEPEQYELQRPAPKPEYTSIYGTDGSGDDSSSLDNASTSSGDEHDTVHGHTGNGTAGPAAPNAAPRVQLSTGVVKTLHSSASARPREPVLLVQVHDKTKRMRNAYASAGKFQVQHRLNVTDGEHTMFALVATQAVCTLRGICAGWILRVVDYACIPVQISQQCPDNSLAMVIHGALHIGTVHLDGTEAPNGLYVAKDYWQSLSSSPAAAGGSSSTQFSVATSTSSASTGAESAGQSPNSTLAALVAADASHRGPAAAEAYAAAQSSTSDDVGPDGGTAQGAAQPPHLKGIPCEDLQHIDVDGFCDGMLCSVYGVRSSECLLKRQTIPCLDEICSECYFADKPVADMSPRNKRCLLYWYWAVNVFGVTGVKVRKKLPACIVLKIRKMHPNLQGEDYIGFKI